jgi:hypothetical protein
VRGGVGAFRIGETTAKAVAAVSAALRPAGGANSDIDSARRLPRLGHPGSMSGENAMNTLAGTLPRLFDRGAYFYGHTVYVVIGEKSITSGSGPYLAY